MLTISPPAHTLIDSNMNIDDLPKSLWSNIASKLDARSRRALFGASRWGADAVMEGSRMVTFKPKESTRPDIAGSILLKRAAGAPLRVILTRGHLPSKEAAHAITELIIFDDPCVPAETWKLLRNVRNLRVLRAVNVEDTQR